MPTILYGVSPIGLGHATRAVAVGRELTSRGAEVEFATGGNAAAYLSGYGFKVHDLIGAPVPTVRGGEMKNASLWYLSYWRAYRRDKRAMARLLKESRASMVVGDEEFSGIVAAQEARCPNALITDELRLSFARSAFARFIERRVAAWYQELQSRVEMMVIPDYGEDTGNRHYVSPVVRGKTRSRADLESEFGLPADRRMVLFSMSGSGAGKTFLEAAAKGFAECELGDSLFVVVGNRGRKMTGARVFDLGVVKDGQDFVAAADLVISTAGKSTIDEAASFGTPIIALPVRNHFEQEANARALGYGFEDVYRLPELISDKVGKRSEARNYEGAARAAGLLLEMAHGGD